MRPCCCCCCCCSHINSHNQVRGHRTGSSHSGAEEYPRENHTQPKVVHTYITADAIHANTQKHIKAKSGVSLRCARSILVHTSRYSRLKKRLYRLPPKKYVRWMVCGWMAWSGLLVLFKCVGKFSLPEGGRLIWFFAFLHYNGGFWVYVGSKKTL